METQLLLDSDNGTVPVVLHDPRHGTKDLHYKLFDIPAGQKFRFSLHWHSEYEIMLCLNQTVDFMADGKLICLHPGEILLINPECVHGHADCSRQYGHYLCFSFGLDFLFPDTESSIYRQVCAPLVRAQKMLPARLNDPDAQLRIAALLQQAAACSADTQKNALSIQICLLQVFQILYYGGFFINTGPQTGPCKEIVKTALQTLRSGYAQPLQIEKLASALHMNADYFRRIFKVAVGISPSEYLQNTRLENALHALQQDSRQSIAGVAAACGFSDPNYFARLFKQKFGISPSDCRRSAAPKNSSLTE